MNNYTIKYYDFINLYNSLLSYLTKKDSFYQICFYYLDNKFNLEIIDKKNNTILFKDNFNTNIYEYEYLSTMIGYEFINNHDIYLPFFEPIQKEDLKYYYGINNNMPLDYDKARVHIIRNSKFELKLYYFHGLTNISYEMQDKALNKLNNYNNKIYRLE